METAQTRVDGRDGYVGILTLLSDFYNSPGSSDHHHFVFLAEGLTEGEREAQGVEEEHMTVEYVHLSEAPQLLRQVWLKTPSRSLAFAGSRLLTCSRQHFERRSEHQAATAPPRAKVRHRFRPSRAA